HGRGLGEDHIDVEANELGRELRQLLYCFGIAKFDCDILALNVAEVPQPRPQRPNAVRARVSGADVQITNSRNFSGLLRARRKRPRRRAAEQANERAPFHSITSSARASSVGGMVRPSALAVPRLRASSNFVGA